MTEEGPQHVQITLDSRELKDKAAVQAARSLIIRSFVSSFIGRPARRADLAHSFSLFLYSLSSRTRGQSTVPAFPLRDLQIHGLPAYCLSLALSLLGSLLSSLGIHMREARSPSKNVHKRYRPRQ